MRFVLQIASGVLIAGIAFGIVRSAYLLGAERDDGTPDVGRGLTFAIVAAVVVGVVGAFLWWIVGS